MTALIVIKQIAFKHGFSWYPISDWGTSWVTVSKKSDFFCTAFVQPRLYGA
jgi:hypothetical protein